MFFLARKKVWFCFRFTIYAATKIFTTAKRMHTLLLLLLLCLQSSFEADVTEHEGDTLEDHGLVGCCDGSRRSDVLWGVNFAMR